MAKLWYSVLLLLALLHLNEAGGAEFLRSEQRFNDSASYDSYYCCNICGEVLVWIFDGVDVVTHFTSGSSVGSIQNVPSDPNNIESLRYSSMIVSLRQEDDETCMDVVLVATQNRSYWRPNVICRGATEQYIVQYNDTMNNSTSINSTTEGALTGKMALPPTTIVSTEINYSTGALICRSTAGDIGWIVDGVFIVNFNGRNIPGDFRYLTHPSNPTIALGQAVVLEKTAQQITSVLFGTGSISEDVIVSCHSKTDGVDFLLSKGSQRNEITEVSFKVNGSIHENNSSLEFPVSASELLSPHLMTIMTTLGIALLSTTCQRYSICW